MKRTSIAVAMIICTGLLVGIFVGAPVIRRLHAMPIEICPPEGCSPPPSAPTPGPAETNRHILHFHGRKQWQWDAHGYDGVARMTGWNTRVFSFDGSDSLSSQASDTVRAAIQQYCTGTWSNGQPNQCIIVCYSAGCFRTLWALNRLGSSPPGLLFVSAGASAAGGSPLAILSTTGLIGLLSKIFGQTLKIDYDLVPARARGTWGYIQEQGYTNFYHHAGSKGICLSLNFLFIHIKLCTTKILIDRYYAPRFPGRFEADDGAVSFDSACGYALEQAFWRCDDTAFPKYRGRIAETTYAPAVGWNDVNHSGMPGRAARVAAQRLGGWVDHEGNPNWGDETDASSTPFCHDNADPTACDKPRQLVPIQGGCQRTDGVLLQSCAAGAQSLTQNDSSTATCEGKCGGQSVGCWCDASCWSRGDCCADYHSANANCRVFNGDVCGDGVCAGGESCSTCPSDCGTCSPGCGHCGDGSECCGILLCDDGTACR